jgi:hypothetical protein
MFAIINYDLWELGGRKKVKSFKKLVVSILQKTVQLSKNCNYLKLINNRLKHKANWSSIYVYWGKREVSKRYSEISYYFVQSVISQLGIYPKFIAIQDKNFYFMMLAEITEKICYTNDYWQEED